MNPIRRLSFIGVAASLVLAPTLRAELQQPRPVPDTTARLESGRTIERDISARQADTFRIALDSGSMVRVAVTQHGIDLVVSIYGPRGGKLAEVDSSADGPEQEARAVARRAGDHRIEIRAFDTTAAPGRYSLTAEVVSPEQVAALAAADRAARAKVLQDIADLRRIHTPEGIETLEQVALGGVQQWISIRGRNRANPVLLFIHGGPGDAMMASSWAFQNPWEDFFTVVQWDQRGVGKNALGADSTAVVTTQQIVADAEELVPYLARRLGKSKIVLLGHSYGTVIAVNLVKRHPEWFSAYVAVGQAVIPVGESALYDRTLELAIRAKDDSAIASIRSFAGYPQLDSAKRITGFWTLRYWARRFGGGWYGFKDWSAFVALRELGPEYSVPELRASWVGESRVSMHILASELFDQDVRKLGLDFHVPVVFLMGRMDLHTPYASAKQYFDSIRAPRKRFVTFERSAHDPFLEEPGRFLAALLRDVLPLTEGAPAFSRLP